MKASKLLILFLVINAGLCQAETDDRWTIYPDRLGNLRGGVTLDQINQAFPETTISVKIGAAASLWRSPLVDESSINFVFGLGGGELFRTNCYCRLIDNGGWEYINFKDKAEGNRRLHFYVVLTSGRFLTKNGIHVGSSAADMINAYRGQHRLRISKSYGVASGKPIIEEYICFNDYFEQAKSPEDVTIKFFMKPRPGKKTAGIYASGKDYSMNIDPRATIVGIQPAATCLADDAEG